MAGRDPGSAVQDGERGMRVAWRDRADLLLFAQGIRRDESWTVEASEGTGEGE